MSQDVKADIPSAFDRSEDRERESVNYTDEERKYRGFLMDRLTRARDQRESPHIEFDDKSYAVQHVENAKAANSYNPPRKNREDSRIVTGTTREKEGTLLSAVLNYNFEGSITPFDKNDNALYELGETVEDLVRKSRSMENWDDKRRLVYKELFDQGTCFVEEVKVEHIVVDKELEDLDFARNGVKIGKVKWKKKLRKLYAECEANLLSGTSVYLGNIREFFLDRQPYAFIRYEIPYDEAKTIYGEWDRWENVPHTVEHILETGDETNEYHDFSLLKMDEEMVEVVKYQDPLNNEMMILLNGVMMLPIEFPLTAISPSGRYTFAKGDGEPIGRFFAYSKSLPAKTKVDQETLDEILKMLLLKMKKSFMPPMANMTGTNLSRKIFLPGEITDGVSPDLLKEIGTNNGPTQSEFNVFQLMRTLINEKSLDPTFSGDESGGTKTATELQQRKQQQMMRLGQTIVGVVELEKALTTLRIHNVLANWTRAQDTRVDETKKKLADVYRTFHIDTTFKDTGRKGTRVVSFDPEIASAMTGKEGGKRIMRMEEKLKEKTGRDIRFSFMDGDAVRNLEATWKVDVVPTEKTSSEIDRVLFSQTLMQGMQMFGPQSFNMEYAKERWAILNKEDPDKMFSKQQAPQGQEMAQEGIGGPQGQQQGALQQVQQQIPKPKQPSVNSLMGA